MLKAVVVLKCNINTSYCSSRLHLNPKSIDFLNWSHFISFFFIFPSFLFSCRTWISSSPCVVSAAASLRRCRWPPGVSVIQRVLKTTSWAPSLALINHSFGGWSLGIQIFTRVPDYPHTCSHLKSHCWGIYCHYGPKPLAVSFAVPYEPT